MFVFKIVSIFYVGIALKKALKKKNEIKKKIIFV